MPLDRTISFHKKKKKHKPPTVGFAKDVKGPVIPKNNNNNDTKSKLRVTVEEYKGRYGGWGGFEQDAGFKRSCSDGCVT